MSDPLQILAEIYPKLENGDKSKLRQAKDQIADMQAHIADLESSLTRQPLPEAPTSATVKVVDPATQMEWLLSFRNYDEDKLVESIPRISGKLATLGVVGFDAYMDGRRAERQEGKAALPASAGRGNLPPVGNAESQTFDAKILVATVNEGKAYWKIKGGKFEKFGVTVWPEVLESAGFFVGELNVMETYNLTGWQAAYTLKDGGKPDKVIKLARA